VDKNDGATDVRINEIEVNDDFFLRDGYTEDAIERYCAMYESGTQKPILLAKLADRKYLLIDGFHRLHAAKKLKWEKIHAWVEEIPEDERLGRAVAENNDATRGIFLKIPERNRAIDKLLQRGKTHEYIGNVIGLSRNRITTIINEDPTLKKSATDQIKLTSVNEWLSGKKQKEVAKLLDVTDGRISQILDGFKEDLKKQYLEGQPIVQIVGQAQTAKYQLTEEKCKELLDSEKVGWLGWNQVIEGDCLKEIQQIPDGTIDLIVTDPPYGIEYQSNSMKEKDALINGDDDQAPKLLEKALKQLDPKLKKDAFIYCFCSWKCYPDFEREVAKHFKIKTVLVWVKNETGLGDLSSYMERHEFVIFGVRGNKKLNVPAGRGRPSNVFIAEHTYKKVAGDGHPTAKPIDLCAELIRLGSSEGEVIVDTFCGSGPTLIAAKQEKRRWLGIEIEPKYATLAKEKVEG